MNLFLNIIWIVFGGFAIAIEYIVSSVAMMCTIIGIPFGLQTLKLAAVALVPFDTHYGDEKQQSEAYMCKRDGYASDKPPDYVEYGVQASVGRRRRQYFGAKRHESHCRKYEAM